MRAAETYVRSFFKHFALGILHSPLFTLHSVTAHSYQITIDSSNIFVSSSAPVATGESLMSRC